MTTKETAAVDTVDLAFNLGRDEGLMDARSAVADLIYELLTDHEPTSPLEMLKRAQARIDALRSARR